jgi:hypothetical protein
VAEKWYAEIDGKTAGPFGRERFRTMADEGKLTDRARVRTGDGPWTHAGDAGGPLEDEAPADGPPKSGSQYAIEVDPSLNDTTEFRMLAETAKVETVKPYTEAARPLPRRVPAVGPAVREGVTVGVPAGRTGIMLIGVAVVVLLIAIAVWVFSGR